MIFEKFKEDVVVEKGWADMKAIKKMAVRLAILVFLVALGVGMITIATVGTFITVIVLILAALAYIWIFDLADEEEKYFRITMKASKLWWLGLLFDIAIYVLLHLFRFL